MSSSSRTAPTDALSTKDTTSAENTLSPVPTVFRGSLLKFAWLRALLSRLPYPSGTVQRVIAIAAVITQAGIGVTGSVVRVTGSGLGCPTWPQCVPGSMVPVDHSEYQALNQWIEFGNRMLTGVVILVAALCVIVAYRIRLQQPNRRRLTRLAWAMPAGVVLQAVVGGMTVLAKLEWWTVAIHFLVSTPLVWLAVLLVRAFKEGDEPVRWFIPQPSRKLLVVLICVMWAVLIAGTTVTGAGPHGGAVNTHRLNAPIAVLAQIHGGLLVLFLLTLTALGFRVLRSPEIREEIPSSFRKRYFIVWAAALAQGALGSVQYALGVPETLVSFHVLGSAVVIISVAALWCSARTHGPVPAASAELGAV